MTQEEKELLLKDLCARLPYGVICALRPIGNVGYYDWDLSGELLDDLMKKDWGDVKPYLRPMSSMTDEEKKQYQILTPIVEVVFEDDASRLIDWLNTHHFDHRGLIPKGLALEAPEGMYNIKTE